MSASQDQLLGILVATVLTLATIALINKVVRGEADGGIRRVMLWGLFAKMAAAPLHLAFSHQFYGGIADFQGYHRKGAELAGQFRGGVFALGDQKIIGTHFIELFTGVIYAVTGPSKLAGFVVYSWLSFCGLLLFYLALRTAVEESKRVRYAVLLFFLPSLAFWTSAIGKDAWMCFTLGLSGYGVARILAHRRAGFLLLGLGLAGSAMVRPHLALMVMAPLPIAYLLRRARRPSPLAPFVKVSGFVAFAIVGLIATQTAASFFKADSISLDSVNEVLERNEKSSQGVRQDGSIRRSGRHGSSFEPARPKSLAAFPHAFVTVVFRPFPFEAHNMPALFASVEGTALLVLAVVSRRRLRSIPSFLRARPYVLFVLIYSLTFVYLFSSIGNFGVLARQRAQLYPFLLVLFVLPPFRKQELQAPAGPDRQPVNAGRGRGTEGWTESR